MSLFLFYCQVLNVRNFSLIGFLGPSNTLTTSVHRKLTDTDQYLQWDSNHSLLAKYTVFNSLSHSPKMVCSSQLSLKQRKDHTRQVRLRCNYPSWALDRLQPKIKLNFSPDQAHSQRNTQLTNNSTDTSNHNIFLVVPYTKELKVSLRDKVTITQYVEYFTVLNTHR